MDLHIHPEIDLQSPQLQLNHLLEAKPQLSFGEMLQKIGSELYAVQKKAQQASLDFSEGKQVELHETMIQQETAHISLRFLMTLRNRMLESYKEVMHLGN